MRFSRAARVPDLAAGGLLIALPLALFWRTISGGLVVAGYDLILYTYPYRVATARALQQGHLPFWNPNLFAGAPFLANIQAAVFYPFNLLFIWPGGPQLLSWSIIVHLALAGLFFYAFSRKALELRWAPAALAAVTFATSGYAIAQSEHLNQTNALPWVPAMLLAFDQACRTRRPGWSCLLGIFLALQIFAGHPQDVYFGLILLVLWAIVLLIRERPGGVRALASRLLAPLLGTAAGVLLAAVQLIPTIELTRYSIRSGGLSWSEATAFALPGRGVVGNLLPDYGTGLYTEWAGYIGLVATVLALYAVTRRWRDARVIVLAVAGVLGVLFALGTLTPVYWLGYHLLPGVPSFRVPARSLLISTFAGSALAGIGAAELELQLRRRRRASAALPLAFAALLLLVEAAAYLLQRVRPRLAVLKVFPEPILSRQLLVWSIIVVLIAGALLLSRRRPAAMTVALLGVATVEMVLAAQPLNPLHALPASLYQSSAVLSTTLPAEQSPYRSLSLAGLTDQQLNGGLSDPRFRAYSARRAIDQPDFPVQDGRATLDGYDGGLLPLASYVRFRSLLVPGSSANQPDYPLIVLTDQPVQPALLGLLGVKDLLLQSDSAERRGNLYRDAGRVGNVVVVENPLVQPRVFLVHDVRPSRGASADLAVLGSSGFDPAFSAIASPTCRRGSQGGNDLVTLTHNDPEALDARVATDGGGLLVISMVTYPGWTATIDGHSAALVEVDDLLQGVCLSPGVHAIQLRFTPSGWPAALGASAAGLLLVLYLGLPGRLRRRLFLQLPDERRERSDHLADEPLAGEPLRG